MINRRLEEKQSTWSRFKLYIEDLAYALDATPEEIAERRFVQIEQRLKSLESKGQDQ